MFKLSTLLASVLFLFPMVVHAKGAKLKDFEGDYVSYGFSAGGNNDGNAFTQLTQVEIDENGNGTTNFFSYSVYTGPIGTPLSVVSTNLFGPIPLPFKLDLLDPLHIAGTITINDFPVVGDQIVLDFVGIKKNGKIAQFYQHPVVITGAVADVGPDNTTIIINKRQ